MPDEGCSAAEMHSRERELTDDDLTMTGRLKEHYGLEKEAAEKEINAWVHGLH